MRCGATYSRNGTVLMETVLVLPILTTFMFAIVQFALIWYAQLMTHYAAYNAARAALVYHPSEYRTTESGAIAAKFQERAGVCWQAAVRTLAPISFSPEGGNSSLTIPGWWPLTDGVVPYSSYIREQVRMHVAADGVEPCEEGDGYVKACVDFDFPLVVPVMGKMIAAFQHGYDAAVETTRNPAENDWEAWGWNPPDEVRGKTDAARGGHPMKTDYMTLHAYCILPKPYATACWALRSQTAAEEVLK